MLFYYVKQFKHVYIHTTIQKREVNTVLGEVIKHVTPDRSFERLYSELVVALEKVLAHIQSVPQVLYMVC